VLKSHFRQEKIGELRSCVMGDVLREMLSGSAFFFFLSVSETNSLVSTRCYSWANYMREREREREERAREKEDGRFVTKSTELGECAASQTVVQGKQKYLSKVSFRSTWLAGCVQHKLLHSAYRLSQRT
jgi:hypothetical protein